MQATHPSEFVGRRTRRKSALLALAIALLVGSLAFWMIHRTYHFAQVRQGVLYRCGNRSLSEFSNAVGRVHPRTVVTLIDDRELTDPEKPQFRQEQRFLENHNIRQVRIPIPLGGWPTSEQIQMFLDIVNNPADQPVLVHCAQGVRRTGMMVAAYELSALHWDANQTKSAIESFGHSDNTIADVTRFIDAYDPAARQLTTTMPSSTE